MRKIVRIPGSTPYGFRLVGGDGEVVTVARVRKESKAEEAGLQEGDAVLAINDVSCQGLSYSSVFGLTELDEHELKMEILRGPDAHSNWRTALACLDTSIQKLSEEDAISLLRNNNKKDSGLFQPSKQQVFLLQDPKPKFKQFSLPRIDVVFDSSDVPTNFVTSPRMTSSQVIRVVQSQEPRPLPSLTGTDIDQGRSFVSRTFQNFSENERSGSDGVCASNNEPLTLQFKADSFKPFSFESTREEHVTTAAKSPLNQPPQKYQSFDVRDETSCTVTTSGPTHRFASTSNIIVTNNSIKPFTNDEGRHWNKQMNFTQTWETKSPKVEHFNSSVENNFENFSRAGNDFPDNFPSNQKFFDEPRNDKFFDVAPTNILKKFNIGRVSTTHKAEYNQEPFTAVPVAPVAQNINSTAWSPVQSSNFQEPFSLSTDFGLRSAGQSFPRFPDAPFHEAQQAPPPPPPPIPASGIPAHQPGSPNELNLTRYVGNQGMRESEKQLLKEKVKMAKDMAHSVLAPANKNSKGQKMFLKRRANSENWAIKGSDPTENQRSDESNYKLLSSPLKPFKSFNVDQTFNPPKPFYQPGSQLYSSPVQPVKWPFDSSATSQISLGYCDL